MMTTSRSVWFKLHRASSLVVGIVALLHCAMTGLLYDAWSVEALWFLGSGLSLLLLAVMNMAHLGFGHSEPCRQPTAHVLRFSNWGFLVFGVAALAAISEPQALVIVAGLAGQAVASLWTLPGK